MSSSTLSEYAALPVDRIDVNGREIHYRRAGSGPPLLMIHGWPLCGATFREYVARLQERWTCIVPDLPGSGTSPWDPKTENMLVDWGVLMADFADALGLDRFAVLAHDSGATMARVLAAKLTDRVSCMALGNTEITNHVSGALVAGQLLLRLPGSHHIMAKLLAVRPYLRSPFGLGGCFDDLAFLDGDFYDACIAPLVRDASGARLAFTHLDLQTTRRLAAFHRDMTAPCMLVWGEDDPFFPLPRARNMLSELPSGSTLEVIPHAKLFVHEEKSDAVMALTEPFLAKHLH